MRYVKLIGHGNHHGPDFDPLNEFTEFEIWGLASDAAGSLGVSSIAASEHVGSSTPQKARDNNLSTRWLSTGAGEWIQFELSPSGTTRSLTGVDIAVYQGNTRAQYFDIQTSMDGENWTLIFKGQSSGTTTQFESYDVPNGATRFVRIVGHKNSRNDENALTEVRLKGLLTRSRAGTPHRACRARLWRSWRKNLPLSLRHAGHRWIGDFRVLAPDEPLGEWSS